jgi:hypothetical protein
MGVFGRVYQDGLVHWPWHGRLESGLNGTGAHVWQLGPGARLHRNHVWQLLVQIVFGSVGPVCHTCLHLHPHPHTPWIQPATSFSRRPSSSPPAGHSTRVRAATFSRPRARAPSVTCRERSRRGPPPACGPRAPAARGRELHRPPTDAGCLLRALWDASSGLPPTVSAAGLGRDRRHAPAGRRAAPDLPSSAGAGAGVRAQVHGAAAAVEARGGGGGAVGEG